LPPHSPPQGFVVATALKAVVNDGFGVVLPGRRHFLLRCCTR
jgi:hypothetical protein